MNHKCLAEPVRSLIRPIIIAMIFAIVVGCGNRELIERIVSGDQVSDASFEVEWGIEKLSDAEMILFQKCEALADSIPTGNHSASQSVLSSLSASSPDLSKLLSALIKDENDLTTIAGSLGELSKKPREARIASPVIWWLATDLVARKRPFKEFEESKKVNLVSFSIGLSGAFCVGSDSQISALSAMAKNKQLPMENRESACAALSFLATRFVEKRAGIAKVLDELLGTRELETAARALTACGSHGLSRRQLLSQIIDDTDCVERVRTAAREAQYYFATLDQIVRSVESDAKETTPEALYSEYFRYRETDGQIYKAVILDKIRESTHALKNLCLLNIACKEYAMEYDNLEREYSRTKYLHDLANGPGPDNQSTDLNPTVWGPSTGRLDAKFHLPTFPDTKKNPPLPASRAIALIKQSKASKEDREEYVEFLQNIRFRSDIWSDEDYSDETHSCSGSALLNSTVREMMASHFLDLQSVKDDLTLEALGLLKFSDPPFSALRELRKVTNRHLLNSWELKSNDQGDSKVFYEFPWMIPSVRKILCRDDRFLAAIEESSNPRRAGSAALFAVIENETWRPRLNAWAKAQINGEKTEQNSMKRYSGEVHPEEVEERDFDAIRAVLRYCEENTNDISK